MTKTVARYDFTASCNGSHGEETYWTEIEAIEREDGEWVRYDDIKHLLAVEPDSPPLTNAQMRAMVDQMPVKSTCKHGKGPLCPECAAENR